MRAHLSLPTVAAAVALSLMVAGCGEAEPVLLPENDGAIASIVDASEPAGAVLEIETTIASTAGQIAEVEVATNPPLTSSSISEPAPPLTLTGADPTTPTTRPSPVASSSTTVAQTVAPTTTVVEPEAGSAPTTPTTPTAQPGSIVEFRIRSGTQAGPWNSFDDPVRVAVGQTLRVHNDDVVPHTIHSDGAPFAHGPTIQPGQYADHPILEPLTPVRDAPVNYEHDAGVGAPFWVAATMPAEPPAQPDTTDPVQPAAEVSVELDAAERESLRLLNGLRANLGVQLVNATDEEMHRFAREWSLEMRNTGFRHSNPPRWFENIVWYSDETMTPAEAAAQFHDMWVNSPGHYDNMTNPDWSVVGVGMWHDETGWWGVHVFR